MSESTAGTMDSSEWGQLQINTAGYVGIDTLQDQIRRRVLRRGFHFNLILVGRSGLGKSTLVDTLFKSHVSLRSSNRHPSEGSPHQPQENGNGTDHNEVSPATPPSTPPPLLGTGKTTQIRSVSHVIEEKGVRLRLTVTDTPGFGDQVNNDNCWVPLVEHIRAQFEKYLEEEQNVSRKRVIPDTRIHCCLYFIPPTGHSLRPLDIEVMSRLSKVVNVIPVIGKADTLTLEERAEFKERLRRDMLRHRINLYPCKQFEDPDDTSVNDHIRVMLPFAVVGSAGSYEIGGRTNVLGRLTHWGLVEVENKAHCEFADLRNMIIRTHMHDLVEVTSSVHYEAYRQERLLSSRAADSNRLQMDGLNESSL